MANYGDQLLPLIAREQLTARLPDLELVCHAPIGVGDLPPGSPPLFPLAEGGGPLDRSRREYFARHFDAVLIGGGDLLRFDRSEPGYGDRPERNSLRPYDAFLDFRWGETRTPPTILWNAPGATYPFEPSRRLLVQRAFSYVRYAAVRDEVSRGYLLEAGVEGPVHVAPDSGVLLDEVIGGRIDAGRARQMLMLPWGSKEQPGQALLPVQPRFLEARRGGGREVPGADSGEARSGCRPAPHRSLPRRPGGAPVRAGGWRRPLHARRGRNGPAGDRSADRGLRLLRREQPARQPHRPLVRHPARRREQPAASREARGLRAARRPGGLSYHRLGRPGRDLRPARGRPARRLDLATGPAQGASERSLRPPRRADRAVRGVAPGARHGEAFIGAPAGTPLSKSTRRYPRCTRIWTTRAARRRAEQDLLASRQEFRQSHSAHTVQMERVRARGDHLEREISDLRARNESLGERIRAMEGSMTWRLFGPYRRLRSVLGVRNTRAAPGEEEKPAQKPLK